MDRQELTELKTATPEAEKIVGLPKEKPLISETTTTAAVHERWLKPPVDYERRGTSEGGSRYGYAAKPVKLWYVGVRRHAYGQEQIGRASCRERV